MLLCQETAHSYAQQTALQFAGASDCVIEQKRGIAIDVVARDRGAQQTKLQEADEKKNDGRHSGLDNMILSHIRHPLKASVGFN